MRWGRRTHILIHLVHPPIPCHALHRLGGRAAVLGMLGLDMIQDADIAVRCSNCHPLSPPHPIPYHTTPHHPLHVHPNHHRASSTRCWRAWRAWAPSSCPPSSSSGSCPRPCAWTPWPWCWRWPRASSSGACSRVRAYPCCHAFIHACIDRLVFANRWKPLRARPCAVPLSFIQLFIHRPTH